jgi:hypothetical protein
MRKSPIKNQSAAQLSISDEDEKKIFLALDKEYNFFLNLFLQARKDKKGLSNNPVHLCEVYNKTGDKVSLKSNFLSKELVFNGKLETKRQD